MGAPPVSVYVPVRCPRCKAALTARRNPYTSFRHCKKLWKIDDHQIDVEARPKGAAARNTKTHTLVVDW